MRHATEAEAGGLLRVLLVWIRPLPADPSELIMLHEASYGMSPATRHSRSDCRKQGTDLMSARIRTLRGFILAILIAGWAANVSGETPPAPEYQRDIRPLLERRCLVCHGCYDAPCQLKLDSYQGLARGGTKEQIYSTERLSPASPSRLFEDAQTTAGWRVLGFSPVLPDQQDASE